MQKFSEDKLYKVDEFKLQRTYKPAMNYCECLESSHLSNFGEANTHKLHDVVNYDNKAKLPWNEASRDGFNLQSASGKFGSQFYNSLCISHI